MTEKQISVQGLTKQGWRKVDEILAKANKQQLRIMLIKIIDKIPTDKISIKFDERDSQVCKRCGKKTNKLYGTFIPHLCKDCYAKTKAEQIKKGQICELCKKPYIDCYC